MSDLKKHLENELEGLRKDHKDHEKELYSEDYEGDWGEGNTWLGYCSGRIEQIEKTLKLLEEQEVREVDYRPAKTVHLKVTDMDGMPEGIMLYFFSDWRWTTVIIEEISYPEGTHWVCIEDYIKDIEECNSLPGKEETRNKYMNLVERIKVEINKFNKE